VGDFEKDTTIEGTDGRYVARLSRDWQIWGPNGGYVAAIALRAAGRATSLSRPASLAGHFLAVGEFDEVELAVHPLREAKRAAALRVSMTQRDRLLFEALVWVVDEVPGLEHDVAVMPDVPLPGALKSIEELVPAEERANAYPFWGNLEAKPVHFVPWNERGAGMPERREWYRYRPRATFSDPFVDAARSLLLIDTMAWPACCQAYPAGPMPYIAPSLDVAVHFHRLAPESEWLLSEATASVAAQGLVGGRGQVWSEAGQLLASGGCQMFCRPVPT